MDIKHTLFGPNREEVWKDLCQHPSFELIKGETPAQDHVIAKVDNWTITLDIHSIHTQHDKIDFTRLRAPYVNKDGFRFKIYRGSFFDEVSKLFGLQDIKIGHSEIDSQFIVQSNNEEKVKKLFADPNLQQDLLAVPNVFFEVRDDEGFHKEQFTDGVDELYFLSEGIITDEKKLRMLYDMFATTLHRLCHLGSAYEDDPHLEL